MKSINQKLPGGWLPAKGKSFLAVRDLPVGITKEVINLQTNEVIGEIKSPHRNTWFFKRRGTESWKRRKARGSALEGLLEESLVAKSE
jgi:hypothetical protein